MTLKRKRLQRVDRDVEMCSNPHTMESDTFISSVRTETTSFVSEEGKNLQSCRRHMDYGTVSLFTTGTPMHLEVHDNSGLEEETSL